MLIIVSMDSFQASHDSSKVGIQFMKLLSQYHTRLQLRDRGMHMCDSHPWIHRVVPSRARWLLIGRGASFG